LNIRVLRADDAAAFQELRLVALLECPTAFASSYEEECDIPLSSVGERLTPAPDRAVFGAFEDNELFGMVGVQRERARKLSHKAFIWGVYVAAAVRKRGLGRRLIQAALDHATAMPGLRQVTLGVNATNSASIALYRSLGFEPYAVERAYLLVDGVVHDEIRMARSI
jgi:ribosomal protein S18 acetylase RimI-like enzyme